MGSLIICSDFTKQCVIELVNYANRVLLINQQIDFISASGFTQDIFGQVLAWEICASVNKTKYRGSSLYSVYIDLIGSRQLNNRKLFFYLEKGFTNFFLKGKIISIFDFMDHMASVFIVWKQPEITGKWKRIAVPQ